MINLRLFQVLSESPFTREDFINKIFPNGIWGFVVQILTLIVMILIVVFFLYKPIKKLLAERAAHVEKNIKAAETAKEEMNLKLLEADERVEREKQKAEQMVKETLAQSEQARLKILEEAKEAAAKEKALAMQEIELAKQDARDAIHNEIVEVALGASKKVLKREVTSEDNKKLIDDFIKDVNNE